MSGQFFVDGGGRRVYCPVCVLFLHIFPAGRSIEQTANADDDDNDECAMTGS